MAAKTELPRSEVDVFVIPQHGANPVALVAVRKVIYCQCLEGRKVYVTKYFSQV